MEAKDRWKLYLSMVFIAGDQFINALIPPIWELGWPDETLSSRTYRKAKDGSRVARFFMPIIDAVFIWQRRDSDIDEAAGKPVSAHCERAYWKEKLRRQSPPEER